ncbi:MAG: hypothetical protein V1660_01265 [archaeon]
MALKDIPQRKGLAEIVREEINNSALKQFEHQPDSISIYLPKFSGFIKYEVIHISESLMGDNVYLDVKDRNYLTIAKTIRDKIQSYGGHVIMEYKEK